MTRVRRDGIEIPCRSKERGQTIVLVLLVLSLFLLAAVGFAVDIANMWFHRQAAQGAADAACSAGAMDLYQVALNIPLPSPAPGGETKWGGFTPGTAFDCSSASSAAPCKYAALNGYNGTGLVTGSASNDVSISFPATAPGVPYATQSTLIYQYPFIRVDVVDRAQVFLIGLLTASKTKDVRAFAMCGLLYAPSSLPVGSLSLHQNNNNDSPGGAGLDLDNNTTLAIVGGATTGISVNSSWSNAANLSGGATINLSKGGPNQTGSNFAVTGILQLIGTGTINYGTTGKLVSPALPSSDPFMLTAAPLAAGLPVGSGATGTHVANGVAGCATAAGCQEYKYGTYPSGITPAVNAHAIFDPGVYYITGGMNLGNGTCARPSTAAGDGTHGTMFYFSDSRSISISGTSGTSCGALTATPALLNCPGNANPLPPGVPSITGNLFLAPCSGPYGDPLGASDPAGMQRGILFFQNRSVQAPPGPNVIASCSAGSGSPVCTGPSLGGSGATATVGTLYFHQCKTTGGVDTGGTGCSPSAWNTVLYLSGSSATNAVGLGNIMADMIRMTQNAALTMNLNPAAFNSLLKVAILR